MDNIPVPNNKRFKIALSFPGEHRGFVSQIAHFLADQVGQDRILYDKYYEAGFARPDLDTYLQTLYREQSELIAVFLCKDYEQKDWCGGLEWRVIREFIKRRESAIVMTLRFDNTDIPGLFSNDGYVWINNRTPQEIAKLILQRYRINSEQLNNVLENKEQALSSDAEIAKKAGIDEITTKLHTKIIAEIKRILSGNRDLLNALRNALQLEVSATDADIATDLVQQCGSGDAVSKLAKISLQLENRISSHTEQWEKYLYAVEQLCGWLLINSVDPEWWWLNDRRAP